VRAALLDSRRIVPAQVHSLRSALTHAMLPANIAGNRAVAV